MDNVNTYAGVFQQMEVIRVSSSSNQSYSDPPTPQICHEIKCVDNQ